MAHGWAVMSGAVVAFTDLVGPTTVTAGEGSTWHGGASPSTSPPISFGYQWRVNGQNQSGATQSAYSNGFALPGAYTVGAIMTYADGVADTNTVTVTSVFGVHISGPNPLDPNQGEGHYEAVVPGGVAPFSYQWWLDGNPTSTSSSFDSFIGMPSSTHELKLRVADAQSHVANTTMSVFVTAGGTCLQPPCP
ncbi:MAG TPA: hypothetical protein VFW98_08925 [Gemmatimonadaceae bacterium]|nr:hypothetical protein [Gemmatimonadaceae bacterium]